MGLNATKKRQLREEVGSVLAAKADAERHLLLEAARAELAAKDPGRLDDAMAELKALAEGATRDKLEQYRQRTTIGAVPPPATRLTPPPKGTRLPRLAGAPAPVLVKDVNAAVAKPMAQARYRPVVAQLGDPSRTEIAAMLQATMRWAKLAGKSLVGQINHLAGQLFERARKATAEFRGAEKKANAIVDAFNAYELERAVEGLTGAARVAAAAEFARTRAFGKTVFYEGVRDGKKRLLGDGTRAAKAPGKDGKVFVAMLDEVKKRSVVDRAPAQMDRVIERIRQRGIYLGDEFIPPERIVLSFAGPPSTTTSLVGYLENVPSGTRLTPGGLLMTTVEVRSPRLRPFTKDLLLGVQGRGTP